MTPTETTPSYYARGGVVCWDVIEAWGLNYNLGCALKYLCRAGDKTPDPRLDLFKAIACIRREIELLEGKDGK